MKKQRFLMILDGPMGSGKSSVAKLLRSKLRNTAIIDWDSLKETISDYEQSTTAKAKLLDIRVAQAKIYIDNDFNLILDGGFPRAERVDVFVKLAKQKKLKLLIYQFTAPQNLLIKRSVARPKFEWQKKKITRAQIIYNIEFHQKNAFTGEVTQEFDTSKLSAKQILKIICNSKAVSTI